jgi:site-specific DNA-cytosine methylase
MPDVKTKNAKKFFNHNGRAHRQETIEHFKAIGMGRQVKKSFRYRAPWHGLTQSITAGTDESTKSFIHPHYHREMTVREYARLHDFPDTWIFEGSNDNGFKQVANSVPIPLGEAVIGGVMRVLCPTEHADAKLRRV